MARDEASQSAIGLSMATGLGNGTIGAGGLSGRKDQTVNLRALE